MHPALASHVEYRQWVEASEAEARDLLKLATELQERTTRWLKMPRRGMPGGDPWQLNGKKVRQRRCDWHAHQHLCDAAEALGVSRKTLSAILNGRAGISPEMAVRLSIAFDTTAESWLLVLLPINYAT